MLARTPLGNMVPWEAHHEGSRTLWEAQITAYINYFYYKLNGWESRSLCLALHGERTPSYRPRSDYQVCWLVGEYFLGMCSVWWLVL